MYVIKPTEEQIQYAQQVLKGNNFNPETTFIMKLTGFIAQTVVSDLLGQERPKAEFDNGKDLIINNTSADIKCQSRKCQVRPHFCHNINGSQILYDVDIYILTSYNIFKKEITICGWISKQDLFKKGKYYEHGQTVYRDDGTSFTVRDKKGIFAIENSKLKPINTIRTLKSAFKPKKIA